MRSLSAALAIVYGLGLLAPVQGATTTTTTTTSSPSAPSTTTTTTTTTTSTTTAASCTAASKQYFNGRFCNVACGIDRPGGNFDFKYTGGVAGCLQACANNVRCVTAQYNEANGYCYLKDTSNNQITKGDTDTIDCAPQQCTGSARTFISGRWCNTTCQQDRPGGDYDRMQTSSFNACVSACAADLRCVSAQYNEDIGFCYLKNMITNPVDKAMIDSVVCEAPQCSGVDFNNDINNCGSCNNVCADNQYCNAGKCAARRNLCTAAQSGAFTKCGPPPYPTAEDCLCWPTTEGGGVCVKNGFSSNQGCHTSRDCPGYNSCYQTTVAAQIYNDPSLKGLCSIDQDFDAGCVNPGAPQRLFTKDLRAPLVDRDASATYVYVHWQGGDSNNVTVSSSPPPS